MIVYFADGPKAGIYYDAGANIYPGSSICLSMWWSDQPIDVDVRIGFIQYDWRIDCYQRLSPESDLRRVSVYCMDRSCPLPTADEVMNGARDLNCTVESDDGMVRAVEILHSFSPIKTIIPICRECGTKCLEVFHTSQRDQTTLCPACFEQRQEKCLVKDAGVAPTVEQMFRKHQAAGSTPVTSSTHPLDRWQTEHETL